jgi:hypothetical protein
MGATLATVELLLMLAAAAAGAAGVVGASGTVEAVGNSSSVWCGVPSFHSTLGGDCREVGT